MTFIQFLWSNVTKILGLAQLTVAYISTQSQVIPEHQLKWWVLASGILTIWCGFGNTAKIASAVSAQQAPPSPLVQPPSEKPK